MKQTDFETLLGKNGSLHVDEVMVWENKAVDYLVY